MLRRTLPVGRIEQIRPSVPPAHQQLFLLLALKLLVIEVRRAALVR
jgi:hypothetical protein